MIGVVVWSSESREKAIIWCEDQGALAYLQGTEHLDGKWVWPATGDLVELSSETIGNIRHARRVTALNEQSCPTIPASLGAESDAQTSHLRLVATAERIDPAAKDFSNAEIFTASSRISAAG